MFSHIKSIFNRVFSLIISFTVAISVFAFAFGMTASAQTSLYIKKDGTVNIQNETLNLYDSAKNATISTVSNTADKLLLDGWNNFSDKIYVSQFRFTVDDAKDLYCNVFLSNPDYFFVNMCNFGLATDSLTGLVVYIVPKYIYTQVQYKSMKQNYDYAINKLLGYVTNDMSNFDKALTIHDRIALNCEYDNNYYTGRTIGSDSYTAYGALVNKKAVCQGYALAYMAIMDRLGIDCSAVTSDSMNHMWNMIKLDNSYYHVDITWDDSRTLSGSGNYYDYSGNVSHKYFLLNDSEISAEGHNNWKAKTKSVSTTYSHSFIHSITECAVFCNGGYYFYIDGSGKIIKRSKTVSSLTTLYTINNDKWYTVGRISNVWSYSFAHLAIDNNTLYFNNAHEIKSISLNNGTVSTVYNPQLPDNECIVGIGFENGTLKYDILNNSLISELRISANIKEIYPVGFSVILIDKTNSEYCTQSVSAIIGEHFGIYIVENTARAEDAYIAISDNSSVVDYDETTGEIIVKNSGKANIIIYPISDSSEKQVISFAVTDGTILRGDSDNNGIVNALDILLTKKYIAGIIDDISINKVNADVNADGKINAVDILITKKSITGIIVNAGD